MGSRKAPLPAWGTRKSKTPAPGDVPRRGRHGKKSRRPPTLPHCGAVPSAQPGLTSLFGMGRGGAPAQWPPGMDDDTSAQGLATEGGTRRARRRKAGGRERAGTPHTLRGRPEGGRFRAISSARLWRRRLCTCALSTSWSATALTRSPNLADGFALRCFQRLSGPDADTRPCAWRHNRLTGGLSTTVLSY